MSDAVTNHLEIERKFDVGPDFVMPDFRTVPGCASVSDPELYRLSATYYDTEDLRLMAHKITLRHRAGGTDQGWHLKRPVKSGERRELQLPLTDGPVPQRLADEVADITQGQPLRPVAVLNTERTVRRLIGPAGEVLAEAADDSVSARRLVPQRPEMRWREVEVELVTGQPSLLEPAGKLLQEAGARPSRSASKLGRVLAEG
jgi:inorganic triphosphatase YgiF